MTSSASPSISTDPASPGAVERARLDLALEAGNLGTWEWDVPGGRIVWSPQQERLYGLDPGAFEGNPQGYRARMHPDDVVGAWRGLEQAIASSAHTYRFLHRAVRPDGDVRWIESRSRFLRDDTGRALRLVGVSTDVTERLRFDHVRLRQDEMLGAVDVGLWYCDLPFSELIWDAKTKEHFWLAPDARVTIDTFYERIHPGDRARTRAAIERSIAERSPYDVEYRTVAPDEHPQAGAIRWVRAIGYTAYGPEGQPIRFDGVTVDVTAPKAVAEQLAVSEQRYEFASRATSNAIWDWTFAGGRVTWNQGVYAVFGYAPGDVAGTADWWYEHIHPEDRERVVTGIHAVIDVVGGPVDWQDEYRFRRGDGTHATVVDRGYVARDPEGVAVRMIGAMEDVTARRQSEAELRRSEERFRSLATAIGLTWVTNAAGEVEEDMPAWRAYTGQPEGAVQGFGWVDAVHPDDRERAAAAWNRAVKEEGSYDVDYRIRAANGAYGWFNARGAPVRGANGRVREWVGVTLDVQARYHAEAARDAALTELESERARLADMLHQAPAAISMTRGPTHVGVLQNALSRNLAGRDTVGLPARDAFPELEGQGVFEVLDDVYARGEPVTAREVAITWDRDGDGRAETEAYFNIVYQPVRGFDGRVDGVLTHSVNVTLMVRARREVEAKAEQLERLSQALERSNRELDQFAYVTSHDLKAPLRGIGNLAQWIEEDVGESLPPGPAEHLKLLQGRVQRMEALIDGILAYARAARQLAKPERVDTGALVADVVNLLAPPPGVVAVAGEMPGILAELVPLQQVFMNLISNALKHGRTGAPRVSVSGRDAGTTWEFAVTDNGPGIASEFHERIWGIFQTLEARDKVESTGIGLAVVKKIVETRGGRVWVDSAPGAGATFAFSWPK